MAPGGLLVAETPSRRNAGAHYTPRDLAEEIVLHALEPLYRPGLHGSADRDTWRPVSSDELLDLKVADIACGSGAFLVAAARYLSARLIEVCRREGTVTLPPHELEVAALRKVVAMCLYGADINGMAVEMCKLSLWRCSSTRTCRSRSSTKRCCTATRCSADQPAPASGTAHRAQARRPRSAGSRSGPRTSSSSRWTSTTSSRGRLPCAARWPWRSATWTPSAPPRPSAASWPSCNG